MIVFSLKLNKNFALDYDAFYNYRSFSDGIDFIEFHIIWDKYEGDHKPSFSLWFSILNFCIIDFEIYNIHHVDGLENLDE